MLARVKCWVEYNRVKTNPTNSQKHKNLHHCSSRLALHSLPPGDICEIDHWKHCRSIPPGATPENSPRVILVVYHLAARDLPPGSNVARGAALQKPRPNLFHEHSNLSSCSTSSCTPLKRWRLAMPTAASWRLAAMASSSNRKRMKTTVGNPSKGQKRKERIYSHYFLTKDNEDRFQVVMQRKLVAKRKVILKPEEVNEFQLELIRRGWERLGSYPSTFSVTLVKEFYANAKVTTSVAPTFLSYVRGKRVPFDADTINEFLGTQLADDVECQFSVLDDKGVAPGELIQALCLAGEGFHRDTIPRGSLHPLARFWSAFVHANISPCSHVSDLTEGRATILYTILTGRVMDVGQFIANEIHQCANAVGKAALGHLSLITHLCSLAGVDIFVPSLEKATQDLDFSYFQSVRVSANLA
ncbi:hypothetical protein DEO72_LG10g1803 [Vigna unguiculata]|uniref:Putative plant transposon protein domain-containing protein n=1 Tax=Vigna unguiculata TaxID=3917 RepID=A0A4D6N9Q9_VIGUN|nr:hypothetical protein DEO72_LG10g1803 [Vigna unguiculata]